MKCEIDNADFNPGSLIYTDQGYGVDPGRPVSSFVLRVADDELLDLFAKPFREFVEQCREDDNEFIECDIPELRDLGYPSLDDMLSSHRALLAQLFKDFLYFQILDALIGKTPRREWRFAVNEVAGASDDVGRGYLLWGTGYFLKST